VENIAKQIQKHCGGTFVAADLHPNCFWHFDNLGLKWLTQAQLGLDRTSSTEFRVSFNLRDLWLKFWYNHVEPTRVHCLDEKPRVVIWVVWVSVHTLQLVLTQLRVHLSKWKTDCPLYCMIWFTFELYFVPVVTTIYWHVFSNDRLSTILYDLIYLWIIFCTCGNHYLLACILGWYKVSIFNKFRIDHYHLDADNSVSGCRYL